METRTIDKIEAGAEITFEGSTTMIEGSIGRDAKIKVINGSLIIRGNVEAGALIDIINNRGEEGQHVITQGDNITFEYRHIIKPVKLIVDGDVQENVNIAGDGNVSIKIKGSVANGATISSVNGDINAQDLGMTDTQPSTSIAVETTNGSIKVKNVGPGAQITTTNGSIACDHVAATARVRTTNGSISCEYVAKGASIKTTNGNIICRSAEEGAEAKINIVNGRVKIAGRTVKKTAPSYQSIFVSSYGDYTRLERQDDQDDCCKCICAVM